MTTMIPVTLDIEGLEIEEVKINRGGQYEISVKSTIEGCTCHVCGKHIEKYHGKDGQKRIRHLPILGRETYLIVRLPRFQYMDCHGKPTTTQQVPWHDRRSPNTIPFEKHILLGLMGSTVEDVSQRFGLGYEAVMGIVRRHIKTGVDWDSIGQLQQIGLDEISLKKGHKDFVTIVSAYIGGRVQLLAVLTDRKKETVKEFLETIPEELKKTVKSVCSDMYDGFINAAQDSFRITKRAIKTEHPPARQRLLQRTEIEKQSITEAESLLGNSSKESDALFVLALWATFERFLRDDLQKRGQILCQTHPPDLGTSIYEHFEKEVEFWKPVEILDFLKKRLFKTQPDLIGHAKQVLAYRDWVAHGKNPKNLPSTTQHPKDVFKTLNEIVETLLCYPPSLTIEQDYTD